MDTVHGRVASDRAGGLRPEPAAQSQPVGAHPSRGLPWLHIRGQFSYHGEALVTGTVAGLTALRDALSAAIESRDAEAEVFANDGEGYVVTVRRAVRISDMGSPPYIDDIARQVADLERQFLRKHERYNRDLWEDRWNRFRRDRDASLAEDAGTAAEPRSGGSPGPQGIARNTSPASDPTHD